MSRGYRRIGGASTQGAGVIGAHPRVRGEHEVRGTCVPQEHGSSPHARGALRRDGQRFAHPRLIPACAGSTGRLDCSPPGGRAHPRMRGEHFGETKKSKSAKGSSPHARGAPHIQLHPGERVRLIPACAGSTSRRPRRAMCRRAHPRMRGEHRSAYRARTSVGGSSPHARGARDSHHPRWPGDRLIPACAGSTSSYAMPAAGCSAHPRMRGEHGCQRGDVLRRAGSSPHARGARRCTDPHRRKGGLIPACAGSTSSTWTN